MRESTCPEATIGYGRRLTGSFTRGQSSAVIHQTEGSHTPPGLCIRTFSRDGSGLRETRRLEPLPGPPYQYMLLQAYALGSISREWNLYSKSLRSAAKGENALPARFIWLFLLRDLLDYFGEKFEKVD